MRLILKVEGVVRQPEPTRPVAADIVNPDKRRTYLRRAEGILQAKLHDLLFMLNGATLISRFTLKRKYTTLHTVSMRPVPRILQNLY